MNKKKCLSEVVLIVVVTTLIIFAQEHGNGNGTGFSIKNLKKVPSYERYEFQAKSTTMKETPVILEYTVEKNGKEDLFWRINGSMPLNKIYIEEKYKVRLQDLNILGYSRAQTFKRGTHTMSGELNVDTYTGKPDEFIVSTLQAIMYLLRTFPLKSDLKEIFVRAPQQTKGKMNLRVRNRGLKNIKTLKYGEIKAYNLEVSLVVPLVGAFLPNIDYYFLGDDVHTLVAMKGVFSMTGKKMEIQLVDYISKP